MSQLSIKQNQIQPAQNQSVSPQIKLKRKVEINVSQIEELEEINLQNLIFMNKVPQKCHQSALILLFESLKRLNCKNLYFDNLRGKGLIIEKINNSAFINLQSLTLKQSRINNIEPLEFLNAPNLSSINLRFNEITSVQPFNKSNFSNLTKTNLQFNQIMQYNLSRANFTQTKITNLMFFSRHQQKFHFKFILDLRFLAKIKQNNSQIMKTLNDQQKLDQQHQILGQFASIKNKVFKESLKRRFLQSQYDKH